MSSVTGAGDEGPGESGITIGFEAGDSELSQSGREGRGTGSMLGGSEVFRKPCESSAHSRAGEGSGTGEGSGAGGGSGSDGQIRQHVPQLETSRSRINSGIP